MRPSTPSLNAHVPLTEDELAKVTAILLESADHLHGYLTRNSTSMPPLAVLAVNSEENTVRKLAAKIGSIQIRTWTQANPEIQPTPVT